MINFPFNAYCAAIIGAFTVSLLSLPLWRSFCIKINLVDDPGHRKIHSHSIPLAGGFSVLTGIVVPLIMGAAIIHWNPLHSENKSEILLDYGLNKRLIELAAITAGAFVIILIGWLDDQFELRPIVKFGGQLIVAALVAGSHVRITLFVHSAIFSYAITMLWILTVINAFNFMDNMNGLCAGLGAISAFALAIISGHDGQYLVTIVALLTGGALTGFIPCNFPKASAFLGDMGSHLTGYLLAVMTILPHFYSVRNPHPWAVLTPLLILAVPLGDLAYVVVLRWRIGQPFYVGDNNHLSHRLVRRGWTQQRAVLSILLLHFGFTAVAVILVLVVGK